VTTSNPTGGRGCTCYDPVAGRNKDGSLDNIGLEIIEANVDMYSFRISTDAGDDFDTSLPDLIDTLQVVAHDHHEMP
jgi:hypothetical protein